MRGGAGLGHPRRPAGGLVCVKLGGRARGGRGGQVDEVRRVRQGGVHLPPDPAPLALRSRSAPLPLGVAFPRNAGFRNPDRSAVYVHR